MKNLSDNVRGFRRHEAKQAPEWFSAHLEADGVLEPDGWERKKRADGT